MKILIFSVAYHPFIGGAEIAVKEITDRLTDFEFHLITINHDGKQKAQEKIGNVHVYRIGSGMLGRYLFPFLGAWKGLSLHVKEKFDLTWSIMASYSGFAALFFKYRKPDVPFVLTLQEGDSIGHILKHVWFIYPLFKQIFQKADKIQAISNYLAVFGERMVGAHADREPITVIPNGVDVSLFTQAFPSQEIEAFKNKLGKKLGDVFLITTSRLVKKNGVADVIKSLKHLPTNFKFLILGTGELEQSLRNLAQSYKVADRVSFLGLVAHADIPKYLKASDIFIRPSLSEGMGNSFIEAMAAGIPVIATPVGGIPDFIEDGKTGFFCRVNDPQSIAKNVIKIAEDGVLRAEIIKNAHTLAVQKYDWNLVAENMKELVFKAV